MSRQILLILSSLFIISCLGDFEEKKLLDYSDKNEKFKFEIIEKDFNADDSLNFEEKRFVVLDFQNRIINKNNSQFLFYNNQNKIQEIKSVYRRGGNTNILIYKYLYDKNQNLKLITYQFNDVDTIQILEYDEMNHLIQKYNPFRKSLIKYKYHKDKISEITEFENGEVSKYSTFIYDNKGNKSVEDWVFNKNQRMRTYFNYNSKNKLISERDSSFTNSGHPKESVESLDKYFYDKNDSLTEKRQYGRVLSEKEFKYQGKITYEYKKL